MMTSLPVAASNIFYGMWAVLQSEHSIHKCTEIQIKLSILLSKAKSFHGKNVGQVLIWAKSKITLAIWLA